MKLVGGDSGRHEREELVERVLLAPSERVVVDVLFAEPGRVTLEHRTPERSYALAEIAVSEERPEVDSVVPLWKAANFLEREVWDMYGIKFRGH